MGNKMAVKVTFNSDDPFDAEIIPALVKEKNKAGFIRKALFCFIRALGAHPSVSAEPARNAERDKELNKRLSKLTDY
jgi:hypothetical protein